MLSSSPFRHLSHSCYDPHHTNHYLNTVPCSFTLLQCFFSPNPNLAVLLPFIHQFFIQKPLPPSQLFSLKKSLILSRPFRISAMANSSASFSNRITAFDRFYSPPVFRKLQREQQKRFNSDSVEPDLRTGPFEPAFSTVANLSNLDRLLDAFTPSVPAHSSCEVFNLIV